MTHYYRTHRKLINIYIAYAKPRLLSYRLAKRWTSRTPWSTMWKSESTTSMQLMDLCKLVQHSASNILEVQVRQNYYSVLARVLKVVSCPELPQSCDLLLSTIFKNEIVCILDLTSHEMSRSASLSSIQHPTSNIQHLGGPSSSELLFRVGESFESCQLPRAPSKLRPLTFYHF